MTFKTFEISGFQICQRFVLTKFFLTPTTSQKSSKCSSLPYQVMGYGKDLARSESDDVDLMYSMRTHSTPL